MRLPKTVRVAGQVVQILREDLSDDGLFGYYSHDRKVIILAKDLKDKVLLNTLRHELMEASLCISGVGFCESMEQEAIVRCMEEVFFPVWERIQKRTTSG